MAQKLLIFASMLLLGSLTANADWLSRYWDGCKPSCSWSGKPTAAGMGLCKNCDKQDQLIAANDQTMSSCDGGPAYTCWDMSPVAVSPTLAYGFVASNPSKMSCGSCYELTFTGQGQHGNGATHQALNGKKMIVMASNIGGDVANDQFDLLVPGGGVGAFDAFSSQIGVSDLGERYGGLLSACQGDINTNSIATNQSCLKTKCAQVFGGSGKEKLKAGCDFYADWLMGANNPKFTSSPTSCPEYLTNAYKNAAGNPPGGNSSSSGSSSSNKSSSSSLSSSSSSSSNKSSSSTASGIGNCILPPGYGPPPNGIETCIVVNGRCYKCNPARGQECLQEWLWDGSRASDDHWFTEVSCPTTGPGSSSSGEPAPVILPQIAIYGNGAHIQANGIYLQVMNSAKLELFDLRGNSVKKMNFSNGVYSVQLNDLPKGLYLARVSFGSERKILRIPLR